MIVNVIVLSALVLAGIYVAIWASRKDFRDRIEAPKQLFQQQVNSYDASIVNSKDRSGQSRGV